MLKRFQRKVDAYSTANRNRRWIDLALICDFRSTDSVLDMGSAEALVTLEVAPMVSRIHGVELNPKWVERSIEEAKRRNIENATFEQGSAIDYKPDQYDVVLFLGVLTKSDDARDAVGLDHLAILARAAKRQIVIRYGVQAARDNLIPLQKIFDTLDSEGFDAVCFPRARTRGNVIVGNRRGTDARIKCAPPYIIVPAPQDHPCLQGTHFEARPEFSD